MAELEQQLRTDLTTAMKARNEIEVATLRMALAAITTAKVAGDEQVELDDDEVQAVLHKEVRRRIDAAAMYEQGGRPELAGKEQAEAAVLERYLPATLDDDALAAIVAEEVAAAAAAGAQGGKAMGAVIKAVRARAGAGADGAKIAALVKAALG